jgi:hypothetical protein
LMPPGHIQPGDPRDRRKFERVSVAYDSRVLVLDNKGTAVGVLRQIARGGFMMEPDREYKVGKRYKFTIREVADDLKIEVNATVCYGDSRFVGCEFVDLTPEAAVDVGILIGKYYDRKEARG